MRSRTGVAVERVEHLDHGLVRALGDLVSELSSSAPIPRWPELQEIIESPATTLLVARDAGGEVVGSLTLVLFRLPSGMRAWIEDVVVAGSARGAGVGTLLVDTAIRTATEMGARTIDLTSRPDRVAANRLYLRAGFEVRQTNVYRYSLADCPDPPDGTDPPDGADGTDGTDHPDPSGSST